MAKVIIEILKRQDLRLILSILTLMVSVGVVFVGLKLYCILQDEAYMGICCKNYENSPLAMMVFFVGNLWMELFGDTCMSLRVLCRVCILLAIGIGAIYLWGQTRNLLLTSGVTLFAAITANLADITFYNWDTGAYPIVALGTFFLLRYVDKPSVRHLFLLCLSGGVMTASRIPLIAFSVIILIAIIAVNDKKDIYWRILLAAGIFIFAWVGCALLMVGSIDNYIHSFRSENIIPGHSVDSINTFIDIFMMLVPRLIFFIMPVTIGCLFGVLLGFRDKMAAKVMVCCEGVLFLIILVISLIYLTNIASYVNEVGLPLFLISVFWLVIAKSIGYQDTWVLPNRQTLKLGLLLGIMLLLGFGSDMWFNKWTVIFLLPMSLGVIWTSLNSRSKRAFKLMFLLLVPVLLAWVPIKAKFIGSGTVELTELRRMNAVAMSEYKAAPIYKLNRYFNANDINSDSIAFVGSPVRYIYMHEFGESSAAAPLLHLYHWSDQDLLPLNAIGGKVPVIVVVGPFSNFVKYLVEEKGYLIDCEEAEYSVLKMK